MKNGLTKKQLADYEPVLPGQKQRTHPDAGWPAADLCCVQLRRGSYQKADARNAGKDRLRGKQKC